MQLLRPAAVSESSLGGKRGLERLLEVAQLRLRQTRRRIDWRSSIPPVRLAAMRLLLLFFLPCLASAQSNLWQTPGEVTRDKNGNVVMQDVKDPKNFTVRHFENGKWALTLHFRPNTDNVTQIEAPDFTTDVGYAADGVTQNSVTVHGYGRPLVVRGTRDYMSTDGMLEARVERDERGRDVKVTYGATTIATVQYAESGGVKRFTLGNTLAVDFAVAPDGTHEVLSANGKVVRETIAKGYYKFPRMSFSLDAVADRLGLPDEWQNVVRPRYSTMNMGPLTVTKDNGDVLVRLVHEALGGIAFEPSGEPLFYDIGLDWASIGGWTKAAMELQGAFAGVLPTHMTVTREGMIQAWLESPAPGAIMSLQTSLKDSSSFRFKIALPQPPASASTGSVVIPRDATTLPFPMIPVGGGGGGSLPANDQITQIVVQYCGN